MSVSPVITARWRTGRHVGDARPAQLVQVQRGVIDRAFGVFTMLNGKDEDFGFISKGKHNGDPWHGFWRSTGDWITVPNVSSIDLAEQFNTTGVADPEVATILIENVVAQEINGVAGIFRQIKRGLLAPWRGFTFNGRAKDPEAPATTEWFDVLNGGYRIRIDQGYGDALETVFMGLIDDTDTRSDPDQITITARNMGALFTDQRVFGWNKARDIRSPIVFADRDGAQKTTHVGANADASTVDPNHSYQNVLKEGATEYWLSHGHADPAHTEWIEVHLSKGRYSQFFIHPEYAGMEMYLSVYLHGSGNHINGESVGTGWVDIGLGNVPGAEGGFPYVKHWGTVDDSGYKRKLPFVLDCDDGAALRVSFRRLGFSSGKGDYRAKVSRMFGYRQTIDPTALKNDKWILVDDAADVVKWVFMWAGFHEWEVEPFGAGLKTPIVFHQGDYLVDIISHMAEQGNYIFFVDRPSSDPDSIGVPRFVRNRAVTPPKPGMQEVRSKDLLTGVETKFTKEPLSFVIRARGKELRASSGGVTLGEDLTNRVQAIYFPPWSGAHRSIASGKYQPNYPFAGRLAGMVKHEVHFDEGISTADEAMMACLLIAIQEALAAFTGTIEVPGYPGLRLNESISVVDTPSGTNTRMWIASRHSTFTKGPDGAFTMSLAGSMTDTPDTLALAADYLALLRRVEIRIEK